MESSFSFHKFSATFDIVLTFVHRLYVGVWSQSFQYKNRSRLKSFLAICCSGLFVCLFANLGVHVIYKMAYNSVDNFPQLPKVKRTSRRKSDVNVAIRQTVSVGTEQLPPKLCIRPV